MRGWCCQWDRRERFGSRIFERRRGGVSRLPGASNGACAHAVLQRLLQAARADSRTVQPLGWDRCGRGGDARRSCRQGRGRSDNAEPQCSEPGESGFDSRYGRTWPCWKAVGADGIWASTRGRCVSGVELGQGGTRPPHRRRRTSLGTAGHGGAGQCRRFLMPMNDRWGRGLRSPQTAGPSTRRRVRPASNLAVSGTVAVAGALSQQVGINQGRQLRRMLMCQVVVAT